VMDTLSPTRSRDLAARVMYLTRMKVSLFRA